MSIWILFQNIGGLPPTMIVAFSRLSVPIPKGILAALKAPATVSVSGSGESYTISPSHTTPSGKLFPPIFHPASVNVFQPRHGFGSEKILRHEVKRPISAHITEDITLLAFPFWGKAPMVGYRMEEVFYVVWLDKNFDLYDHN